MKKYDIITDSKTIRRFDLYSINGPFHCDGTVENGLSVIQRYQINKVCNLPTTVTITTS